jgi:hypothetical protein
MQRGPYPTGKTVTLKRVIAALRRVDAADSLAPGVPGIAGPFAQF